MIQTAKNPTESYRYVRGEWAAAGELIELLAEFEIMSIQLAACNEIHVYLDSTGLDRLATRIYRLKAAEILGLDYYDKATQEWRGMWNGLFVAVRTFRGKGGS
jgi:hypothetical protein